MSRLSRRTAILSLLLSAATVVQAQDPAPARVQPEGDTPREGLEEKTSIVDRQGAQLPLELTFRNEQGNKVRLGDYFEQGRPVLLTMVYYRCPSLCSLVLNEVVEVLKRMDWVPGQEFELVTVSINPQETSNLARAKKEAYLDLYGRPGAAAGWHFLNGSEAHIKELADAIGFGFEFDTATREYAHSAGLFVCTPRGVLSRTLYGVLQDPDTVKFSLLEAGEGQIGSPLERLILYCYHYDPQTGVYTAQVMNIMRLAGLTTLFLLGSFIGLLHWRDPRRRASATQVEESQVEIPAPSGGRSA